jgi:hypothetical protein
MLPLLYYFLAKDGGAKIPITGRKGRSLLFQDDLQFLGVGLRVFPFRHLHKTAEIGVLPPVFPALRQAAQKGPRSVFHFVYREQSRHFARPLSFLFSNSSRTVSTESKIDAEQRSASITGTCACPSMRLGKQIAQLFQYF